MRERERGAKHRTHICDRVEGDRESLVQSNLFWKEKLMGTLEKNNMNRNSIPKRQNRGNDLFLISSSSVRIQKGFTVQSFTYST